jgi:predicted dehydrogenase
MVEKPMAANSAGAWAMVEAARSARVVLSTPYVWRFHPVTAAIRERLHASELGAIAACEGRCAAGRLHRYIEGHAEWMLDRKQSGGGPMYNLGVHWIDLFRWLLEDEVVDAVGRNVHVNREHDVEDSSLALLTFSHGTVLSLDISYMVPDAYPAGRDLYLAMRGTRGVVQWSPSFEGTREELFVCTDAPRRVTFEIEPRPGYAGIMTVRYLEALARSIREGAPPPVSGEDGARVLEIVERIYDSAPAASRLVYDDREGSI